MSKECRTIHKIFNQRQTHSFPFNEMLIPKNGIYILFEKGEKGHGAGRIVRVGTHTGENQLRSRLKQHFLTENKDRSIFRKNIGRAILNKRKDEYLSVWEVDFTTREIRNSFGHLINKTKQEKVEKKVTKYIQNNFSFVVLDVVDKNKRLELESKIISTISLCDECKPSKEWLGNSSPKEKIRVNGLWLVNELNKTPLSQKEVKNLIKITHN